MKSSHYAALCSNSRSLSEYSYYNMRYEQARTEEFNKYIKETFELEEGLRSLTDHSPLDWHVVSGEIPKIDPQAHKFLALRKRKFAELTKELAQKQGVNSCTEARYREMNSLKTALPLVGLFLFPVTNLALLAVPAVPVVAWAKLNYRCRVNEEAADERTIKEATEEELKGGFRFYQACQKVEQVLWKNKSLLGKLFSSVADSRLFRDAPLWEDCIAKIEKKLGSHGKKFLCTEEDQKIIALLEVPIQKYMERELAKRF